MYINKFIHYHKLNIKYKKQFHCVQTDLAKNVWTRAYLIPVLQAICSDPPDGPAGIHRLG